MYISNAGYSHSTDHILRMVSNSMCWRILQERLSINLNKALKNHRILRVALVLKKDVHRCELENNPWIILDYPIERYRLPRQSCFPALVQWTHTAPNLPSWLAKFHVPILRADKQRGDQCDLPVETANAQTPNDVHREDSAFHTGPPWLRATSEKGCGLRQSDG